MSVLDSIEESSSFSEITPKSYSTNIAIPVAEPDRDPGNILVCISPSEVFAHVKDPQTAAYGDCVNMLEPREFRKSEVLLQEAYKTNLIDSRRSAELDTYSVKEWRILKNLE